MAEAAAEVPAEAPPPPRVIHRSEKGLVQWFSRRKGMGFIGPTTTEEEVDDMFVHQTAIECEGFRALSPNDDVAYNVGVSPNGDPCAVNVIVTLSADDKEKMAKKKKGGADADAAPAPRPRRKKKRPKAAEKKPPRKKRVGPMPAIGTAGTGTVIWYSPKKGIGFFKQAVQPGADIFVHQSALDESVDEETLKSGAEVTYVIGESPKDGRPCAIQVKMTGKFFEPEEPDEGEIPDEAEEERRYDGEDGPFTLAEFLEYYHQDGEAKWAAARKQ